MPKTIVKLDITFSIESLTLNRFQKSFLLSMLDAEVDAADLTSGRVPCFLSVGPVLRGTPNSPGSCVWQDSNAAASSRALDCAGP